MKIIKTEISIIISAFLCLAASITLLIKANRFSWDSWIYYRLANKLTNANYDMKIYSLDINSIDFPFGFPIIISIANKILGSDYINAVYVNILFMLLIILLIYEIIRNYNMTEQAEIITVRLLVASLIFNPFFCEEIYSGRSMPAALLILLAAYYILDNFNQRWYMIFLSGLIFGLSVTIRYDLIVGSLAIMTIGLIEKRVGWSKATIIPYLGFILGVLPWILFSELYFGKLFASANSAIALSSIKLDRFHFTAVEDYINYTIFNHPKEWFVKVFSYIPSFSYSFIIALFCQPFFILQYAINIKLKTINVFYPIVLSIIFFPHLFAGFFDQRYFSFYFLFGTLALVGCKSTREYLNTSIFKIKLYNVILIINILIFILYLCIYIIPNSKEDRILLMMPDIQKLKVCHLKDDNIKYVILPGAGISDAAYSGITGLNVVFPVSYNTWYEYEKINFFESIGAHKIVSKKSELFCD